MTQASGDRLLSCGLCYEEDGEEVHPHPECRVTPSASPIGSAEGIGPAEDQNA